MKPTLLVLAAGMGSRYGGLKQMDPVGPAGETIIDYSVFDAARAGFGKVVFVIRPDFARAFQTGPGARFQKRLAVDYAFQELDNLPEGFTPPAGREKPWGTGQAVLCAEKALEAPFAVINADDFYGQDAFQKMARYLEASPADYAMVGYRLGHTLSEHGAVARGLCRLEGEFLCSVEERTQIERNPSGGALDKSGAKPRALSGDEIVSMNFWGFTPAFLPQLREAFQDFLSEKAGDLKAEFYIPTAVDGLIRKGKARVRVLRTSASWFGVTYREDRPWVERSLRALVDNGYYPSPLWS